jgi:hypothetical protein
MPQVGVFPCYTKADEIRHPSNDHGYVKPVSIASARSCGILPCFPTSRFFLLYCHVTHSRTAVARRHFLGRYRQVGSRLQHLVALLSPLHTLHAPLVHLLLHLCVSLSLLLCCALGPESIGSPLCRSQFSHFSSDNLWTHLSIGFLLLLHFLLLCLDSCERLPLKCALIPRSLIGARSEGCLVVVPLLACAGLQSACDSSHMGSGCTHHSSSFP